MKAQLHHIDSETENIKTFWFKPEKPFRFSAGQFSELYLPHTRPDVRGEKRWFTISSSPRQELVSITTRIAPAQGSSFKQILSQLRPGATVEFAEAMGDFVMPLDKTRPLIFIAGGIGLTPFLSMLAWLADTNEQRNIKFMYAVRSEQDIIFQDAFARANQHVTIVVSDPSSAWGGERGAITSDMILGIEQPSPDSLIYLSGPEPMIEGIANNLISSGTSIDQIVTEPFPGYSNT